MPTLHAMVAMARRSSLTSTLYSLARASNNIRAASRGPAALVTRQVRRRVYRKSGSVTRSLLRAFGLGK